MFAVSPPMSLPLPLSMRTERPLSETLATITTPNRALGPHETPAAALRFGVYRPLDRRCIRSGWYGTDLELRLDEGARVWVPLSELTLRSRRSWMCLTVQGPEAVPLAYRVILPLLRWWEAALVHGMRVQVRGLVEARNGGYRDADVEAPLRLRACVLTPAVELAVAA